MSQEEPTLEEDVDRTKSIVATSSDNVVTVTPNNIKENEDVKIPINIKVGTFEDKEIEMKVEPHEAKLTPPVQAEVPEVQEIKKSKEEEIDKTLVEKFTRRSLESSKRHMKFMKDDKKTGSIIMELFKDIPIILKTDYVDNFVNELVDVKVDSNKSKYKFAHTYTFMDTDLFPAMREDYLQALAKSIKQELDPITNQGETIFNNRFQYLCEFQHPTYGQWIVMMLDRYFREIILIPDFELFLNEIYEYILKLKTQQLWAYTKIAYIKK